MAKKTEFTEYTLEQDLSLPQRIAHFLDWASTHRPYEQIPYNLIVQCIMGYKVAPRVGSPEVVNVRKLMTGARSHLLKKYQKGMVTAVGVGVRATVDDADMVKTDIARKSGRLQSAAQNLATAVAVIDTSSKSFQAMDDNWKGWFNKNAKEVVKQMNTNDYLRKLLPPGSPKLAALDKKKPE